MNSFIKDNDAIISQLKTIVGGDNVLLDNDAKKTYGTDLTKNYIPDPLAIVFPTKQQQVIAIIDLANLYKIGLVPSGGRTGYSGGAVAKCKEIVVSFDKFNQILDFNPDERQIKCEPGVITKTIQELALKKNLLYPVDFASAGSSQIGGNIATNAGGIKVIRYGLTRNWVSGLTVVTGKGDVLKLNYGLTKNASGYDFRHLFIGSEGTLGFITEATLRLTTLPSAIKVILFSVPSNKHFINILNVFQTAVVITAFEFFCQHAMTHVMAETGLKAPFSKSQPFYVLLEYESDNEADKIVLDIVQQCVDKGFVEEAIISYNTQQIKSLWRFRENISMSLLKYCPYKYDIAVLPTKIMAFIEEATAVLTKFFPQFETVWFGHVGDGNLHLNVLKPSELSTELFFIDCNNVSQSIYALIQKYEGTISAEHGVGLLKKEFLHFTKSEAEIGYMRQIKKIFDPNNIMNPEKIM